MNPGLNWTLRPNPAAPTADDTWMANFEYLVTINMVHADGLALSGKSGASLTAVNEKDDYDYQGTSMSSPHVAAAAALIWSLAPTATPTQVRSALTSTARDLGAAGLDSVFGYGMLDVLAAAKSLAPAAFIPPIPTSPKPTTAAASAAASNQRVGCLPRGPAKPPALRRFKICDASKANRG